MKKLLSLCLLLAAAPAMAQTTSSDDDGVYSTKSTKGSLPAVGQEAAQPFKGANTIIIHIKEDTNSAFLRVGRAIVASGYSPTQKDNDLLFLLTAFRPISQEDPLRISLRVSVTSEPGGAAIALTGSVSSSIADLLSPITATPKSARVTFQASAMRRPWNELMRVADACQGDQLGYAVRP